MARQEAGPKEGCMGFPEKVLEKKSLDKLGKEAGWGLGGMEGWKLEGAGWAGWVQKIKKE